MVHLPLIFGPVAPNGLQTIDNIIELSGSDVPIPKGLVDDANLLNGGGGNQVNVILWATDGSKSAYTAGEMVRHLLTGFPNAKVIALYVREIFAYPPQALVPSAPVSAELNEQQNIEKQITGLFGETHLQRVKFMVVEGHPAVKISEEADHFQADLIVVGSHGYHGLNRLVLGSVSRHLLDHTVRPVLVVR